MRHRTKEGVIEERLEVLTQRLDAKRQERSWKLSTELSRIKNKRQAEERELVNRSLDLFKASIAAPPAKRLSQPKSSKTSPINKSPKHESAKRSHLQSFSHNEYFKHYNQRNLAVKTRILEKLHSRSEIARKGHENMSAKVAILQNKIADQNAEKCIKNELKARQFLEEKEKFFLTKIQNQRKKESDQTKEKLDATKRAIQESKMKAQQGQIAIQKKELQALKNREMILNRTIETLRLKQRKLSESFQRHKTAENQNMKKNELRLQKLVASRRRRVTSTDKAISMKIDRDSSSDYLVEQILEVPFKNDKERSILSKVVQNFVDKKGICERLKIASIAMLSMRSGKDQDGISDRQYESPEQRINQRATIKTTIM